jgi:tetratricopeptide (TPR) repeat protein
MASFMIRWRAATCVAFGLLLGMPTLARAESDAERAGARSAAEAGLAAYNAGRYADALDLLRRAESLVHAPTHLLYMARASEKLGQLVQARELYLKITREPLTKNAPRAFVDAQHDAEQEVPAIERRLPYLTIKTDTPLPSGVKVKLDEREIPSVLVGVPFPANPGKHVVVAVSASGNSGEPANLTLAEGKRETITIKVPPQAAEPAPPVASPPPPAAAQMQLGATPTAAPPERDASNAPGKNRSPILAYTAIGVGVVGAAVGTVFLIQRGSKQSDADSAYNDCKIRYCGQGDINKFTQLDKDAATAGTISIVSYSVGAAALTAGLYLLLTGHSKQTASLQPPRFVPYVGLNQAGASLSF